MALLAHRVGLTPQGNCPWQIPKGKLLPICLLVLAFGGLIKAGEIEAPAERVQAAFLYNFTKLVTWPTNVFADSNSPIVIGIIGNDAVGAELEQLNGLKSQGRTIRAVRYESAPQITNCQVLFISSSEKRRLDLIFDELREQPILTVGNIRGFANRGMIELVRTDGTFDLRINPKAAARAQLQLSSRLIRLDKRISPSNINPTNSPPKLDE